MAHNILSVDNFFLGIGVNIKTIINKINCERNAIVRKI